jgi:hypothetical protein
VEHVDDDSVLLGSLHPDIIEVGEIGASSKCYGQPCRLNLYTVLKFLSLGANCSTVPWEILFTERLNVCK